MPPSVPGRRCCEIDRTPGRRLCRRQCPETPGRPGRSRPPHPDTGGRKKTSRFGPDCFDPPWAGRHRPCRNRPEAPKRSPGGKLAGHSGPGSREAPSHTAGCKARREPRPRLEPPARSGASRPQTGRFGSWKSRRTAPRRRGSASKAASRPPKRSGSAPQKPPAPPGTNPPAWRTDKRRKRRESPAGGPVP